MIKKIKRYSLLLLLSGTCSCSGFLDEVPNNAIPENEAMQTLEDASSVVIGIYSAYKSGALYSGYLTQIPDIQSDLALAANTYSGIFADAYRWEMKPTNGEIQSVYGGLYSVIARCNFFMDYKHQVEATLTTDAEKKSFDKRLGDVYFARALAYADLIRTFCEAYDESIADKEDMGVSIALTYQDDEPIVKRSTLRESYAQVLSDLEMAEKLIPAERASADSPYFSPGAVHSLKARVYLYMKNYEKAIEAASKVINSGTYALDDATYKYYQDASGRQYSPYEYMWKYDEGDEIIWKIAMTTNDRGGALGKIFLGFNGSTYSPDFVAPNPVMALYTDNDMRYGAFFGNATTADGSPQTLIVKYTGNPTIDGGSSRLYTNMPKVFRLSEQYLIRAEAYYFTGKYDLANKDLTTLRKKRITGYGSASASAENLLKEIQEERVRELYMEGFRLSDIKRFGLNVKREKQLYTMNGAKNNELEVKAGEKLYNLTTWPIPKHEIEASNGVIKGNASNN
ncbi:MAG: RagB/SusD family nutrient uptake outer membrane protein [Bacteroidales bacterium]